MAENEILLKSYLDEKRKLEYQIIRDNRKNEPIQKIIDTMYGPPSTLHDRIISPKPEYKFEKLAKKYPAFLSDRNTMRNFHWRDAILKRSSNNMEGMSSGQEGGSGIYRSGTVHWYDE